MSLNFVKSENSSEDRVRKSALLLIIELSNEIETFFHREFNKNRLDFKSVNLHYIFRSLT